MTAVTTTFAPPRDSLRVMNIYAATDLYLAEAARQGKSPRTCDRYRRHFDKLGDMFPHYDVDEITPTMVRRFLDQWQNASPATSAQIISMLRSFFGWLHDEGFIQADPTDRLQRPKLARPEEQDHLTSLSTGDVQKMLAAADGWSEKLALNLLAYTGSRRNAVAQLRRRDYDQEAGEITFVEKGQKTIRKPIPGELRALLDAAIAAGVYDSADDFLVPSEARVRREHGRDDKIIWKLVKRVAARVGIEAHVHAFRAAFAVYFLERKPDKLIALQSLLGHSNLETTRIYLRRLDRRRAMEEVRDLDWSLEAVVEVPLAAEKTFPSLRLTEKEGFEPSFDGSAVVEPEGTPSDSDPGP